ncbi:xanthine dehydrogenase family protein subunit M [Pseudomaricurvus alkylphenolicus]|uniref:FAD binding domain-containing protein n=1 Tax=Pseudomaricurvus alkylphenolicus TaxID=1306991 RepID=UPI001423C5DF|nr:xanthine dehydrogenase family protein subunit M [Pseudomaricurvus alkylphenolicus]NIB40850.1 xanthine dehydrogenase family protein subunit M [Pseudomaricurvus alkylphenolicus]
MKAPLFDYVNATSLDQALGLLDQYGEEARIIAGGQSLMATLNMRLSQPQVLIDINSIQGLSGVRETRKDIRIGALTRHMELLESDIVKEHLPLIASAMPHVAHVAIRNRGTIGGSLSMADPAAELPACCVALDATFELSSRSGQRVVKARDFFSGLYTTERQDNEILTQITIPKCAPQQLHYFEEINRRQGDFAIVGLACTAAVKKGLMSSKRSLKALDVVIFGCEDKPTRLAQTCLHLIGTSIDKNTITAAKQKLEQELNPTANLEGRADTKLHLATVLLERALLSLARDIGTID